MVEFDVAIVGGSVAGAALAVELGAGGARVVLFDKARFPRRKACGEGLLPHGVEALRMMGLADPPGIPFAGLRYHAPSGEAAEVRFEDAGLGPGLMVRREEFDAWLLDRARATPNVEVREGVEIETVHLGPDAVDVDGVRVYYAVGADGMRSLFHRGGTFVRRHPRRERVGIAMRVRGVEVGDLVDVYLAEGGEAYVGPAGKGEASLAVLLDHGVVFDEFVWRIPALKGMQPTTPKLGASPLGSEVTPLVEGRVLLIGDAAGAPDPVTGEGMAMALQSVMPASAALQEALATREPAALMAYERARRRLAEPSLRLARLILWMSRRSWAAERAMRRLQRDVSLFRRMVRYLCGAGGLGALEPVRLLF
ncbi:MAG: FAD-dependent monooxygenase [Planctomycetes bacterium]|nr:FAD-dependent monooxygenase [Planctomycetota bacterium]